MFRDMRDEAWHDESTHVDFKPGFEGAVLAGAVNAPEEYARWVVESSPDQIIKDVIADYRTELLDAMRRYHGCDVYDNERACRADVYRIDRVILPIVRKMLEDMWEDRHPKPEPARVHTKEENIAFRKAWDERVERGKAD
jgi:hypothetical protein